MNRKELKDSYKQMKPRMGVFQIRNTVNGKIYIEGSSTLDTIWNRHRAQLNFGGHPNAALQSDWKALGEDKFVFEILAEIGEQEGKDLDYAREIKTLEQLYIEDFQPFGDKGYNRTPK